MEEFFARLKEHKLVQWTLGYIAVSFALLPVLDIVAERFGWSQTMVRCLIIALGTGFFVMLVIAWYHGERGAQRVTRTEHAILAVLVLLGGLVMWRIGPVAMKPVVARPVAAIPKIVVPATPVPAPVDPKSVAVLPFENLSDDKDNAYFADGMQDLILTKLADIGDLKVISRTSTAKYASHPDDLKAIARQLGVATILEGSVQKAGNQVLINVQLVDVQTDNHLWAEAYPRTLDNIFGVEGEVAQKVADALKAKLTPPEAQAVAVVPTRNPQAYDDYLRAQHFDNEASAKGAWATDLPKAIAAYEKAVAEDPGFALAWAGLSAARTYADYFNDNRSVDNLRAAEDSARRALALAPNLAEAHVALAQVYRFKDHDYKAARDEAQRALQLRPNDADAFLKLSWMESHLGNYDAALKAGERAAALDPNDSFMAYSLALARALVGDYPGARQALMRALAIDPQNAEAYASLSRFKLVTTSDIDAAIKVLDGIPAGTPPNLSVSDQRISLLLYKRDFGEARTLAAVLAGQFVASALHTSMVRGNVEWLAGNKDQARPFYLAVVDLLGKPASDVTGYDLTSLGLACARLGRTDAAVKANREAMTLFRRSGEQAGETEALVSLAKIQLALGHATAAIDALTQAEARPGHHYILSQALLQLDPTWDPIRDDLRFQALLKPYTTQP